MPSLLDKVLGGRGPMFDMGECVKCTLLHRCGYRSAHFPAPRNSVGQCVDFRERLTTREGVGTDESKEAIIARIREEAAQIEALL